MDIEKEVKEEHDRLYKEKYGKRNPATLSSLELDAITHEAARRVQRRRKERNHGS